MSEKKNPAIHVNLSGDEDAVIQPMKDACVRQGFVWKKFVINALVEYFTKGGWAKMFKENKE